MYLNTFIYLLFIIILIVDGVLFIGVGLICNKIDINCWA